MDAQTIATLRAMIADQEGIMARLIADKPTVTDGHSDGKRVRYVRAEVRAAVIAEVLAMIGDAA